MDNKDISLVYISPHDWKRVLYFMFLINSETWRQYEQSFYPSKGEQY